MPYSAQLAPTASAKRRFVELQFLVKGFDVGYTLENVNGVGILGNGGPLKKAKKQHNEVTCRLIFNRSRAPRFPSILFGLIDDHRSPVEHPAKTING
jgi:hypothetical protein